MPIILDQHNSILSEYLFEIRDKKIQLDSLRFRTNIERIGELMAYEISKSLSYQSRQTETVLGVSHEHELINQPVILSILRAGLPMHHGILKIFDKAKSGFIAASRISSTSEQTKVDVSYSAWPDLKDETVIIADPMLATGTSLKQAIELILKTNAPKRIIVATIISHKATLLKLAKELPNVEFWTAAADDELNTKNYIVPGLGDAGDLAYGPKL